MVTKKGEGGVRSRGNWEPGSPGTGREARGPAEGEEQVQGPEGHEGQLQSFDYHNHVSYLV